MTAVRIRKELFNNENEEDRKRYTAFIVPIEDEFGGIVGYYPVLPQRCEVVEYNGAPFLRYTFASGQKAAIEFERVGVLTNFQYKDDFFGESNAALRPTMQLIHTQNQGIIQGVKNSASIRFLAKVANMLKPEDITKERKRFTADNLSAENQSGIDLLVSLVEALPEIIATIVQAIPQIIEGIVSAFMENIPLIIQAGIDLLIALIQALPEIITTIVQAIPQIVSGIVNALIGNIDQIIMAGVQLFVALIQNLPTIIVEIVKAVPQIVSGIVQAFASLGGELVNAGANLLHGLWEGISGAASWLWEKVSGWASSLVSGIKDFFGIHSPSTVFADIGGNMADGVGVGFTDNMSGVESDMTAAMGGAGQLTAAEAVNAVNNGIIANIEGLSGAVNAIVERVITGLTAQAQRLNQAGQDFDKNIASGMITAIVQITQKIPQIVQPIITALHSFVSQFTDAGEEMVRGIWQGFQNMSGWLESRVRSMMQEIVAAVEDEMDIASPSKVFAGIGSFMAQGLGEGFAREMRSVESTIRRETRSAVPEVRSGEGRQTARGTTPTVEVVQNIYANETSYAEQQRQAARQFRQIAREVMA